MSDHTPRCFLLRNQGSGVQLYVSELSTLDGLAMFPDSLPARVTEFGAHQPGGGNWVFAKDLPPVHNVASLRRLLLTLADITLVDFSVDIAGEELSTHDDGECHFIVGTDERATEIVHRLLGPAAPAVIELLLANRELYVGIQNGTAQVFHSFDEYLNSGPT